jgi:hypothetical protein
MILIDLDRKAQVERALAEIERAGGTYLRQAGGRSGPVVALDLDATIVFDNGEVHERGRATDAILLTVARLGDLRELSLDGAGVTDAGLVHLKRLKKLRRLNLSQTAVTDAGVASLTELPGLQTIDLRGTRVTAAGARQLRLALPTAEILTDESDR